MSFKVFMHPKPMKRHTKHMQPASASVRVVLPSDWQGPERPPGFYLELLIDGAVQLIRVPVDQLQEMQTGITLLRGVPA